MRLKVYRIENQDISGTYSVDFEGDVTLDNVADILRKTKYKFKLPGSTYTVLAGGRVFHVFRANKVWKAYELKEKNNED